MTAFRAFGRPSIALAAAAIVVMALGWSMYGYDLTEVAHDDLRPEGLALLDVLLALPTLAFSSILCLLAYVLARPRRRPFAGALIVTSTVAAAQLALWQLLETTI